MKVQKIVLIEMLKLMKKLDAGTGTERDREKHMIASREQVDMVSFVLRVNHGWLIDGLTSKNTRYF